ncbi:MAG: uroporphyrinogen decarboxylase [Parvularculaceae bacterium]|nr:uroporphyrinogen decarboxylase [Parvularculaceae bacterium]
MNGPALEKPLLATLRGVAQPVPPIWFMRQAGRYLPEYRATRAEAGSFLDLCFNPALAAEVTLQPIRRYRLDGAILFADILLIPFALGQSLSFVEGEGPRLDPPVTPATFASFRKENVLQKLAPIAETVSRVRAALPPSTTLLGFAGAPWTVATYMLAGGPSDDPAALRAIAYRDRRFVDALIETLIEATIPYLVAQIDAGADAVQLFDTWAGGLPEDLLLELSLEPMRRVAAGVKAARPKTPVIFFPRGAGAMLEAYARLDVCDTISIDTSVPWVFARERLSPHAVVQGGLDPLLVVEGGAAMERAARRLRETFAGAPYVFNLGHGFTPKTPPENVARLVEIVREG